MIVKEYWPGFIDRGDEPKVWNIKDRTDALKIDFFVEKKAKLSKDGHVLTGPDGLVIGVLMNDDGTPLKE